MFDASWVPEYYVTSDMRELLTYFNPFKTQRVIESSFYKFNQK